MAINNNVNGITGSSASSAVKPTPQQKTTPTPLNETSTGTSSGASSSSKDSGDLSGVTGSLGEHDFLTLLVNQLQHQDPLNPMDPKEFSGQLAQFSTVEQLISINKKLDGGSDNAMSSMASYLGNEVVLKGDQGVDIQEGEGPNLIVDFPAGTQSARVDLLDKGGAVVSSSNIESPPSGRQVLPLKGVDAANGNYDVRVVSVSSSGSFKELSPKITGTVEGFVLEPEPKLLVGGKQVGLEDVVEVYKGQA